MATITSCGSDLWCVIKFVPLWTYILAALLLKVVYDVNRRTMAAATRLDFRIYLSAGALAAGYAVWGARESILELFTGPGKYSRLAVLFLLIVNYKNIPGVWHIRVWYAILSHFTSSHKFTAKDNGLNKPIPALFQPSIYHSRSPLYECDYNLHKSNSTYYSDLDVARSHHFTALMHQGVKQLQQNPGLVLAPDGKPAKGSWSINVGAVSCSWKKEIQPYAKYEMWTRIIAWDRKWIYLVTHFVKPGTVRPHEYTLTDGSTFLSKLIGSGPKKAGRKTKALAKAAMEPSANPLEPKIPHKALYASALTRYVMKLGRLTIHPEVVIERSGLLPPRPGGWNTMNNGEPCAGAAAAPIPDGNGEVWDWKRIEEYRVKGLQLANRLLELDDLNFIFTGSEQIALEVGEDPF